MAIIFSKLLTRPDVESYLDIPACSLGPLPFEEGNSMNMHVRDDNGQEWIFGCTIKRNECLGQFLSVGWAEFARRRDVTVDDKVVIHEEVVKKEFAAETTWIKIEVKRKIRLFGEDIWADVK